MKLFLCVKCNQIFNLTYDYKECKGSHGGVQYIDNINAKVWGDLANIFVLGFANSSLSAALRDQVNHGDLAPTMRYAGRLTPPGRDFTAFVIPESANSIQRVNERFEPIEYEGLSRTMGGGHKDPI